MCPLFRLEQILSENLNLFRRTDTQFDMGSGFEKIEAKSFPAGVASGQNPVFHVLILPPMRFEPEGNRTVVAVHGWQPGKADCCHLIVGMPLHVERLAYDSRLISGMAVHDSGGDFLAVRADYICGTVHRHVEERLRSGEKGARKEQKREKESFHKLCPSE